MGNTTLYISMNAYTSFLFGINFPPTFRTHSQHYARRLASYHDLSDVLSFLIADIFIRN